MTSLPWCMHCGAQDKQNTISNRSIPGVLYTTRICGYCGNTYEHRVIKEFEVNADYKPLKDIDLDQFGPITEEEILGAKVIISKKPCPLCHVDILYHNDLVALYKAAEIYFSSVGDQESGQKLIDAVHNVRKGV